MKNNLILIGFLGVLFACNGAEKKYSDDSANFGISTTEKIVTEDENNETVLSEEEKGDPFNASSKEGILNSSTKVDGRGNNSKIPQNSIEGETSVEVLENLATKQSTGASNKVSDGVAKEVEEKKKLSDPIIILMEVVPDEMRFNIGEFTVTAGQEVIIELENLDGMEHNLLISKPGTLNVVGAAADALARDPKGAEIHYVPEIPEVLFATEMLEPGDFATLKFTAPKEPGVYPFVCTFPGHWRMMNGVMKVVAAE